jgi:Zn-dependent protease with chaperone function
MNTSLQALDLHSAHLGGCALCGLRGLRSRRQFTHLLLGGAAAGFGLIAPVSAWAQQGRTAELEGVQRDVGGNSKFTKLVSAEQVEGVAQQQYAKLTQEASSQRALAPADHPQVVRLRAIAARITPFAPPWNARAQQWKWEINLLGSQQINAFCMPGGKIAFYLGILQKLQLTDDEVATIMGHEVAHALREHARERMGKSMATQGALGIGAAILGLGDLGRMAAGVTLWQKMAAASKGAPPQWLSTHPAGAQRIKDIQSKLPKVQPLYERAAKPTQRFSAPAA